MHADTWLVRYSEIFLKSEPVRRVWENLLISSLKRKIPLCTISKTRGRIWISGEVDPDQIGYTFGVYSYSPCRMVNLSDLRDQIIPFAEEAGIPSCQSFAIRVRRTGKHTFSSQELARDIGAEVCRAWPHISVDLTNPDLELHIEIRNESCYLYHEVFDGPGGVPEGASGKLVALHSGGIDSPVAMYMMMKRGCILYPVYVKIAPFHDDRSEERARLLISHLQRYQPDLTLKVIPDEKVYETRFTLKKRNLEKYCCVLCKRHLYRIAEEYAQEVGAKGIVTGESVAQVASQTLDNLYVLDDAVHIPVYRPLIGFDKEETIQIAKQIGTFQISIMQVPGCCSVIPFRPATTSERDKISLLEKEIGMTGTEEK